MTTELVLREDEQTRQERFSSDLSTVIPLLKTVFIATPALVGGMYLLMRHLPKEAFPKDFWMIALVMPILMLSPGVGYPLLVGRFVRRKCVLSTKYIRLGFPDRRVASWRQVEEWRVEDIRDDPRHFTVEFRLHCVRRGLAVTVPDTYSKQEVRTYIQHCLAKAF